MGENYRLTVVWSGKERGLALVANEDLKGYIYTFLKTDTKPRNWVVGVGDIGTKLGELRKL